LWKHQPVSPSGSGFLETTIYGLLTLELGGSIPGGIDYAYNNDRKNGSDQSRFDDGNPIRRSAHGAQQIAGPRHDRAECFEPHQAVIA
jgi:hypothetical protein